MYVFYGIHHANEIKLKLPKEFLLNTGHVKLDVVHKIGVEVEMMKNKRQKEKENIRRLSFGLSKFDVNKKTEEKKKPLMNLTQNLLKTTSLGNKNS